jgi:hypothetical protein
MQLCLYNHLHAFGQLKDLLRTFQSHQQFDIVDCDFLFADKQADRIARMERKRKKPRAPGTTPCGTKTSRNQCTNTTNKTQRLIKVGSVLSRQHRAQKPWRAAAHKSGTHNPDSVEEPHEKNLVSSPVT